VHEAAAGNRADDGAQARLKSAGVLATFLVATAAVIAFGSSVSSAHLTGWYAQSIRPEWDLPLWVRATVWELVGVLSALAAWLVWRERHTRVVTSALTLFVAQMVLHALWRPTFFALYPALGTTALWLALVVAVLLLLTVLTAVLEFRHVHRAASLLMLPCLVWVMYIITLNLASAMRN
jgi:tryptophan-rich sensory protein